MQKNGFKDKNNACNGKRRIYHLYSSQIKYSQKCKKCTTKDGKYATKTAGKNELGMYGKHKIVMDGKILCEIFSFLPGALYVMMQHY